MPKVASVKTKLLTLLKEHNFSSSEELFSFLDGVPVEQFAALGLDRKPRFIYQIRVLIHYLELEGQVLMDSNKMTTSGSILEGLRSDYNAMRRSYQVKLKKLNEQLSLISLLAKNGS